MSAQATRDARTHARGFDPIERIKHEITHEPPERLRPAQSEPAISDLEVGVRYLLSAATSRVRKHVDKAADEALREHWQRIESLRRSVGQKFRWAA